MQKLKILVAEDDLLTLTLLENMLSGWGYEVHTAQDGEQAREILRGGGFHLCILDWEMPGMSGRDLCQWIRFVGIEPAPYVTLLTAKGDPQQICDGFAAGAHDYITKPFDRDDLRYRLAALALRVLRAEAIGESAATIDPIDMYRLDLTNYGKTLSFPS
jgi:DNA-binding response OmpR family regulator